MTDYQMYDLGDIVLQCGSTLRDAKLAYKTFGTLNADKTNAIVYPTWVLRPALRKRMADRR